ncbi:PRC-barrel domain containing protein [Haloprofundus salinisoli]|uniref:PRC-barrel domain containing protein n=1 Tax=Haloprofundus salinisoli TaxID=2876193 RepID=UPI001CCFDE05|nr:PRC-barrel domain containing protein [Haloprofundus salinisoli]
MATLTSEDEGKVLVDAAGEKLGLVKSVERNVAYVDPDPGVTDAILAVFGRENADTDDLAVDGGYIETVSEGEIRLRKDI